MQVFHNIHWYNSHTFAILSRDLKNWHFSLRLTLECDLFTDLMT